MISHCSFDELYNVNFLSKVKTKYNLYRFKKWVKHGWARLGVVIDF